MQESFTVPKKVTKEHIYDITSLSADAKSKKVYIFKMSDLNDFISFSEAEAIRNTFLENGVKVQQITNIPKSPEFT